MFKKIALSRFALFNIIIGTLLAGTFLSPLVYSGFRTTYTSGTSSEAQPIPEGDQKVALALQKSYTNVYKKAGPSVVLIRTNMLIRPQAWFDYYQKVDGAGSGIVLDKEGFIVTNNHVVKGAQKIEVIFSDETRAQAKLVGRDETSDVALIQVPPTKSLVPAVLGNSDMVEPGQLAFAIGAPFGLDRTFTVGTISAKQRAVDNSRYSRIQTDASINPGNSGGPLLNIYGEVIGVNQSIISPNGQGGSVGIGFAIPINEVKLVMDQLKKEKRVIGRPALGVSVGVPADQYRHYLGIGDRVGVVVRFVVPGSAAEASGLKENDFITKINGAQVSDPNDLINIVQKNGIGGELKINVVRDGKEMTLKAIIGEDQSR